jgi:ABC-type transport system involved in cytochrome c biogenesis permease subunit
MKRFFQILFLCAIALHAQQMIYHEGRIKPMDTFARDAMNIMAGRTSWNNLSANEWVLTIVNDRERTDTIPFLKVIRADVAELLHLNSESRYHRYVDFLETRSLLQQYAERTDSHPVTREMKRLDEALSLYEALRGAKDYERPLFEIQDTAHLHFLKLDTGRHWFSAVELQAAITALPKNALSPDFQAFEDSMFAEFAKRGDADVWNVFADPSGDSTRLVSAWAYLMTDSRVFTAAVFPSVKLLPRIRYEILYHRVNLPCWSLIFAGIAFLLSLLGVAFSRAAFSITSVLSLAVSGVGLLVSLCWRSLITLRPPLGNLYEVLLSVTLLLVLALCFSWIRWRLHGLLFLGSFFLFALLFFAQNNLLGGDTFKTLPTLLQSSFWLSLHVLTIALGYCGVILAGLCGHALLFTYAFRSSSSSLRVLEKLLYGTLAFGALFTFTGTLFGGFWADVAWGRFWGWDPKENGALLVILWSMIAFHLRLGRLISPLGFAIFGASGLILIALTWFGVNLLGVGLHSYGFENGMAWALAGFIGSDCLFIAFLAFCSRHSSSPGP